MFVIRFAGVAVLCALLLGTNTSTAAGIPLSGGRGSPCSDDDRAAHIVLFERGTSGRAAGSAIAAACGSMLTYYPEIAVAVASAPGGDFAARLDSARSYSAGAVGDATADLAATPTAAYEPAGAGARSESRNMRAAGADRIPRSRQSGSGVVVAVLDSGVDGDHPELSGSFAAELSTGCLSGVPATSQRTLPADGGAHGTHVAGIIASAADGSGPTGVAPRARIASVRVIGDDGATTPRAVVCGLMWAARHDAAVANASFMLTTGGDCVAYRGHPVVAEAIGRAVGYATSHGTVVVAAATNQGRALTPAPAPGAAAGFSPDHGVCQVLPASLPEVVTVSALTATGAKAGYSSYGLGVIDVTAPGGAPGNCVRSTVPGGYGRMCGTSMAAAHVSGVLAVLAGAHPAYSTHELIDLLYRRADAKPCPADYDLDGNGTQDAYCAGYAGYNGFYGHGVIDATTATGNARQLSAAAAR